MAVIDEIGNRYGRLLVLERVQNDKRGRARWLCKCDCGNEVIALGTSLRRGQPQSCGCLQRDRASEASTVDLIGQVFGRLTVLYREGSLGTYAAWRCRCECGNEVVLRSGNLNSGNTRSCGCLRDDTRRLPDGEAGFNQLLNRMRQDAKRRGYDWDLSKEQVHTLTQQHCCYCGMEPGQTIGRGKGRFTYNGLDRKNNERGYTVSNTVPCCKDCNYAKLKRNTEDFRAWVIKVYEYFARQG